VFFVYIKTASHGQNIYFNKHISVTAQEIYMYLANMKQMN